MVKRLVWLFCGAIFLAVFLAPPAGLGGRAEAKEDSGGMAQVLKNQEKILKDLEEIKQRLDVIRVRIN